MGWSKIIVICLGVGGGGANVGAIGGGDNVQHNNFVLHGALLKEIMIMLHCTMEQYNTYVV